MISRKINDPYNIQDPRTLERIFREGNESVLTKAFESFFTIFYDEFTGFAYKNYYVRDEQIIKDAFQDGFAFFYRDIKGEGFNDERGASVKTVFFGYCNIRLLNIFKGLKKDMGTIYRDPSKMTDVLTSLEIILYREVKAWEDKIQDRDRMLKLALLKLGERCRDLIIWRKHEKLKNEEISLRTGIEAHLVTNQVYECKKKLMAYIDKLNNKTEK